MKAFILYILITSLLIGRNNEQKNFPYFDYIPNGKGLVRFHFINVNDTSNYTYFYNTILTSTQSVKRFLIDSDSLIEIEVNATHPTINYFQENGVALFMIVPNDTLEIFVDRKKPSSLAEMISFKGKTALFSEYQSKVKILLYYVLPDKNESPEKYNLRIDSLCEVSLGKLYDFNNIKKLPDWFIEYEKMDIIFQCEGLKQKQYSYRKFKYNQFIENKILQPNSIREKELKINWITDNILDYLGSIKHDKYDTLLTPQNATTDIFFQYIRDNINALKGRLSGKQMSYYVASCLSSALRDGIYNDRSKLNFENRCKKIDSLFNEMSPLISDSLILKFISEYRVKEYAKYLNKKKLVKGQKAPLFFLEDINNSIVELSDFKGKLICLNFWATWCKPCIKSIPMKNELVQKYGKNNFVLINILLDNNYKRWNELIAENKSEGIHLKCKENWENVFRENYLIKGIPHYTLIDKTGIIIMNDVPRDSLEFYVKVNL